MATKLTDEDYYAFAEGLRQGVADGYYTPQAARAALDALHDARDEAVTGHAKWKQAHNAAIASGRKEYAELVDRRRKEYLGILVRNAGGSTDAKDLAARTKQANRLYEAFRVDRPGDVNQAVSALKAKLQTSAEIGALLVKITAMDWEDPTNDFLPSVDIGGSQLDIIGDALFQRANVANPFETFELSDEKLAEYATLTSSSEDMEEWFDGVVAEEMKGVNFDALANGLDIEGVNSDQAKVLKEVLIPNAFRARAQRDAASWDKKEMEVRNEEAQKSGELTVASLAADNAAANRLATLTMGDSGRTEEAIILEAVKAVGEDPALAGAPGHIMGAALAIGGPRARDHMAMGKAEIQSPYGQKRYNGGRSQGEVNPYLAVMTQRIALRGQLKDNEAFKQWANATGIPFKEGQLPTPRMVTRYIHASRRDARRPHRGTGNLISFTALDRDKAIETAAGPIFLRTVDDTGGAGAYLTAAEAEKQVAADLADIAKTPVVEVDLDDVELRMRITGLAGADKGFVANMQMLDKLYETTPKKAQASMFVVDRVNNKVAIIGPGRKVIDTYDLNVGQMKSLNEFTSNPEYADPVGDLEKMRRGEAGNAMQNLDQLEAGEIALNVGFYIPSNAMLTSVEPTVTVTGELTKPRASGDASQFGVLGVGPDGKRKMLVSTSYADLRSPVEYKANEAAEPGPQSREQRRKNARADRSLERSQRKNEAEYRRARAPLTRISGALQGLKSVGPEAAPVAEAPAAEAPAAEAAPAVEAAPVVAAPAGGASSSVAKALKAAGDKAADAAVPAAPTARATRSQMPPNQFPTIGATPPAREVPPTTPYTDALMGGSSMPGTLLATPAEQSERGEDAGETRNVQMIVPGMAIVAALSGMSAEDREKQKKLDMQEARGKESSTRGQPPPGS